MKCKKCSREFEKKRSKQIYCCADCRVNDYRGTKSKWQKRKEVLEDAEILSALGVCIKENSGG